MSNRGGRSQYHGKSNRNYPEGGRGGRNRRRRRGGQTGYGYNMQVTGTVDPFEGPRVIPNQPPKSLPENSVAVLWLRNDLRIRDNAALALANTAKILAPIYIFDPSQFGPDNLSPYGFERTGPFRAAFMVQSVDALRKQIRRCRGDMFVRQGDPVEELVSVIEEIAKANLGDIHVITHKEVTWEEEQQEVKVQKRLAKLAEEIGLKTEMHFVWGSTLHHLDDIPFNPRGSALPSTFTEYRKLIEAGNGPQVRAEIPAPEILKPFPLQLGLRNDPLPSLSVDLRVSGLAEPHDYPFPHTLAACDFKGGSLKAEERLEDFIWHSEAVRTYKETRNDSGLRQSSSKLSPWLALGCISPRTVYWDIKKFEEKVVANESTYWMIFELMTRDYFRWVATSVGTKLFAWNGYTGRGKDEKSIWNIDPALIKPIHKERFQKWIKGQTGSPFVDASMREIAGTGFMSNRGRQNVASFLIHDLEFPDWRAGAEYFESVLIDHDVASNWANWAYLAGVGSDPRGGRKFNVVKQSLQYDPDGWFLTRWCPELLQIPPPMIHEPYTLSKNELDDFEVVLGETYPNPIVKMPRAPISK